MAYKLCSNQRFAVLLILALNGCRAQDPNLLAPNLTEILRKPEAYQRKFVVDYMKAPACHVDGYPQTSDNCDDLNLTNATSRTNNDFAIDDISNSDGANTATVWFLEIVEYESGYDFVQPGASPTMLSERWGRKATKPSNSDARKGPY